MVGDCDIGAVAATSRRCESPVTRHGGARLAATRSAPIRVAPRPGLMTAGRFSTPNGTHAARGPLLRQAPGDPQRTSPVAGRGVQVSGPMVVVGVSSDTEVDGEVPSAVNPPGLMSPT